MSDLYSSGRVGGTPTFSSPIPDMQLAQRSQAELAALHSSQRSQAELAAIHSGRQQGGTPQGGPVDVEGQSEWRVVSEVLAPASVHFTLRNGSWPARFRLTDACYDARSLTCPTCVSAKCRRSLGWSCRRSLRRS